MTFKSQRIGEITVWTGDPDCSAAYALLEKLIAAAGTPKLGPKQPVGHVHIGSMGEALAFLVGRHGPYPASSHRVLADNCSNPLACGSKTGLDILWMLFDANDEGADHAWIQEVKTTVDRADAGYIASLTGDYSKLFDGSIGLSLEERLGDAAFKLENLAQRPDLARRARALGARSAAEVDRVTLAPTGVHDLAVSAVPVIERVRIALIEALDWSEDLVEPHLISLSDLGATLTRLAR